MEKSIEELITEETEQRLRKMEQEGYEYPPRATKADEVFIIVGIVVCLALIVLCMTGVIV